MVAPLISGKYVKWIQALIGGVLSVFIVGSALLLLSFDKSGSLIYFKILLAWPGVIVYTWLFGDPFAKLLPPSEASAISTFIILLALGCWFIFGFVLTYFSKKRRL